MSTERIDDSLLEEAVGVPASVFRPGVSAITMAELAVGPLSTSDQTERAVRQARLQWAESVFEAIPFDTDTARSFGIVAALVISSGRKPRKRLADLLIASTALTYGIPLLTRNPDDFAGLEKHIKIVPV